MKHALIVYSTTEGQTRRIAEYAAGVISEGGCSTSVLPVEDAVLGPRRELPDGSRADGVLLAASIHVGRHSRSVLQFVQRHAPVLEDLPTAFLSVSMSAATPEGAPEAEAYVARFLGEADWQPDMKATAGGALRFEEYGFFKKLLMKRIVKVRGLVVDTSHNHEFTDWDEIRRFTEAFVAMCDEAAQRPSTH